MAPRYNKKFTRTITPLEFFTKLNEVPIRQHRVLALVLYFLGCRITEALNLTKDDIMIYDKTIGIRIYRLKGSGQKHNILGIPNNKNTRDLIEYVNNLSTRKLFDFSRQTAHKIIKRYFGVYPHFFRMNRLTRMIDDEGFSTVKTWFQLDAKNIDYYIAEAEITIVGEKLT